MLRTTMAVGVLLRDEHDDDLESSVHEGAEEETDSFPETSDDFDTADQETADEDEFPDEDDTEL